MTLQIKTLRDINEERDLIQGWLDSDKIGTLVRKGRTIYYATLEPMHLGVIVEGATKLDVARKLYAHSIR